MNDPAQHDMLDDVAVYALGAMAPDDAARVREHLETCKLCREEYAALAPAAAAIGVAATATESAGARVSAPTTLLKARIMRQVRGETAGAATVPTGKTARERPIVWPAYLVAAACFAIALISSLFNMSLMQELRQTQGQLAQVRVRSTGLTHEVADERSTLADLMSADAKRYDVAEGNVVRVHNRLYLTMHDMPQTPRGKVYQAWTLPKGAKAMVPSVTFVPDAHGAAIVTVPVDARDLGAVAVSVEPDGGSKQPTSKPVFVTTLD